MMPEDLQTLLRDLRSNRNVTEQLKKTFKLPVGELPRTKRLAFTKEVISATVDERSYHAHCAFVEALKSLRGLVPFLKSKAQSTLQTIVAVEKYSINHTAPLCFEESSISPELKCSVDKLIEQTLKIVLEARTPSQRPSSPARRDTKQRCSSEKENKDPSLQFQNHAALEQSLDHFLFTGASNTQPLDFLPSKDSSSLAVIVCAALAVRLTIGAKSAPLEHLLTFVKSIAVPWIQYLSNASGDADGPYYRNYIVYARRIQKALLSACHETPNDPYLVLRARAFALTIGEVKLNQYARDLLRCVHSLTRSKKQEEPNTRNKWDVVGVLYDDALDFVARFPITERRWFSEDVSAWMDHIAEVWSRRSSVKPVPKVFSDRITSLSKDINQSEQLQIYKLQLKLIRINAYDPDRFYKRDKKEKVVRKTILSLLQAELPKFRVIDPSVSEHPNFPAKDSKNSSTGQRTALLRLRLLRTLEPLRKLFLSSKSESVEDQIVVRELLELYTTNLLDGILHITGEFPGDDKEQELSREEILIRLQKMICAGLESVKELLRLCLKSKDAEQALSAIRKAHLLLQLQDNASYKSGQSLRKWFAGFLLSSLQGSYHEAKLQDSEVFCEDDIHLIAQLASDGAEIIIPKDEALLHHERIGFVEVARACFVLLKDWTKATYLSLQTISILVRTFAINCEDEEKGNLVNACLSFARDLSVFMDDELTEFPFQGDCSPTLALAALLEYSCWLKRNYSSRGARKSLDPFFMLAQMRRYILKCLEAASSFCALRQLHLFWIDNVLLESTAEGKENSDNHAVRASGRTNCCGHKTITSQTEDLRESKCSTSHLQVISLLREFITLGDDGFEGFKEAQLLKVQRLLKRSRHIMLDTEFLQLVSEILEWVGTALVRSERFEDAALAFEIARSCRTNAGISQVPLPLPNTCKELISHISRRRKSGICEQVVENEENSANNSCTRKSNYVVTAGVYCSLEEVQTVSLEAANKDLKSSLISMMQLSSHGNGAYPQTPWNVAGVNFNAAFDGKLMSGQSKLCGLLALIRCLYSLALALLSAENLADGRYYLERCSDLSSLCFSDSSLFVQSIRSLNVSAETSLSSVADENNENIDNLEVIDLEKAQSFQSSERRDPAMRTYYFRTLCAVNLKELSANLTSYFDPSAAAKLLNLHRSWEAALQEDLEEASNEQSAIWQGEFELSTATAYVFLRENKIAENALKSLINRSAAYSFNVQVISLYLLARTYVQSTGSLHNFLKGQKSEEAEPIDKIRVTRSRTRSRTRKQNYERSYPQNTISANEVKDLLDRAKLKLPNPRACPQLYRRVWNLSGMLEKDSDAIVSAMQRTIGCSFDIRWDARESNTRRSPTSKTVTERQSQSINDSLDDAFKLMSISSEGHRGQEMNTDELKRLLKVSRCVVVGLTIDETLSNLMVWRISGDGIVSHRVSLPSQGENSVSGITSRISDVMKAMKAKSVKPGQEMTQQEKHEWWEHRYSLDEEMQNILGHVESEWLREAKALLIPFIYEDVSFGGNSSPQVSLETMFKFAEERFPSLLKVGSSGQTGVAGDNVSEGHESLGQLVLLLDTRLERIPWESIAVLRRLQASVTRAPSLSFLMHHLRKEVRVDTSSLFYVINPAGDLLRTEGTFKHLLDDSEWRGTFGRTSKEVVSSNYDEEQIYLYCGHGAGDQFLSPRKFAKRGEAPIALLMGCSSGRPDNVDMGDCESNGAAIDYLINGSRAVVANLWDVSDKDIDRFTTSMLARWLGLGSGKLGKTGERGNLAEAVAASRSTCRLPYLVGSAVVVMGVPNISTDDN